MKILEAATPRRERPDLTTVMDRREDDRPIDWMKRGSCIDVPDPDIFFPSQGDPASRVRRKLCGNCPVKQQCLEYGAAGECGVWGGVIWGFGETQAERRAKLAAGPISPIDPSPKPRVRRLPVSKTCGKGHPRVEGEYQCSICRKAYHREWNRKRRAKQKAMA